MECTLPYDQVIHCTVHEGKGIFRTNQKPGFHIIGLLTVILNNGYPKKGRKKIFIQLRICRFQLDKELTLTSNVSWLRLWEWRSNVVDRVRHLKLSFALICRSPPLPVVYVGFD